MFVSLCDIFRCIGACMFIRRWLVSSVLCKVTGWKERLWKDPLYYEWGIKP